MIINERFQMRLLYAILSQGHQSYQKFKIWFFIITKKLQLLTLTSSSSDTNWRKTYQTIPCLKALIIGNKVFRRQELFNPFIFHKPYFKSTYLTSQTGKFEVSLDFNYIHISTYFSRVYSMFRNIFAFWFKTCYRKKIK